MLPGVASAQGGDSGAKTNGKRADVEAAAARPANLNVRVKKANDGKRPVLSKATAVGRLRPFVPQQKVQLRFMRGKHLVKRKNVNVRKTAGGKYGSFKLSSPKLKQPGKYRVRALKRGNPEQQVGRATSKAFKLEFPKLGQGRSGKSVRYFNKLLRQRGYYAPKSRRFGPGTSRAVMAFRKVNWMSRNYRATSSIFKKLAAGKGGFKLKYPGAGRHVEVDIARQVMVLADNGKPQHTFHISSGKSSTPSDRGHFRFFRRQAAYNSIGMYYSVYYNGGEAIHGYKSVPTYPASNGCIRNPIPNSRFIYDWVSLGMSIYVY